jgi:hypothetical protein
MKLKIFATRAFTYKGQFDPQPRHFIIDSSGVAVDVDAEMGNAIPGEVWH